MQTIILSRFSLLLLLFLLIFHFSCRKANILNEPPDCKANSFVLKESASTVSVNRLVGDQLEQINEFEINENSFYAYDGCHYFILLDNEKQTMKVYQRSGRFYYEESFPAEIQLKSVYTDGKNVYIGGYDGDAKFLQYNLFHREWHIPYVPEFLNVPGKSIDDFVIHENQLIAIDNIYIPQYYLYYNLSDDNMVEYTHKMLHRVFYPNTIKKAEISQEYLVVKALKASGWVGYYDLIVLYSLDDMEGDYMILPSRRIQDYDNDRFVDFLLNENEIILAHKGYGIGRIEIDEMFFAESPDIFEMDYEFYEPFIDYRELEDLHALTHVPNGHYFIATTIGMDGNFEHHVFEY